MGFVNRPLIKLCRSRTCWAPSVFLSTSYRQTRSIPAPREIFAIHEQAHRVIRSSAGSARSRSVLAANTEASEAGLQPFPVESLCRTGHDEGIGSSDRLARNRIGGWKRSGHQTAHPKRG